MPPRPNMLRIVPDAELFGETLAALARKYHCSQAWVAVERHRRRGYVPGYHERRLAAISDADLVAEPAVVIAARHGVSQRTVQTERNRRGLIASHLIGYPGHRK